MSLQQSSARKAERRRGVTLTQQGLQKLCQAKIELQVEQNFKRYTLESLSEQTGLTPTTLSKIFTGSAPVDKRTVENCFTAFHLTLLPEDYLYAKAEQDFLEIFNLTASNPGEYQPKLETIHSHQNVLLSQKMCSNQLPYTLTLPGGQVPLNSSNYIDRPVTESRCYEAIQQPGVWINISAPKQMGKTSLMTRILAYGKSQNYRAISINLQAIDRNVLENLNFKEFLLDLLAIAQKQLPLVHGDNDHWEWNHSLGIKTNITFLFEHLILSQCDHPLILAIDELTQLFEYPPLANEFLLLLRTWSEQAKTNPIWRKLRLVTINSTEKLRPVSLDPSLLNTGLVIKLPEFNLSQIRALAHCFEQEITDENLLQINRLLGGHPYRLQLLFYHLLQETITLDSLFNDPDIALTIYSDHLQQQKWNLQRYPQLLELFNTIIQQTNPTTCEAEQGFQLQGMGLVRLQRNQASLAWELLRFFFRNDSLL
ncbi:MAG: AAA-like domain-containing protein [Snowella sp.]|nr:AAA-like domain-containing protein [Snowella sp.]